MQYHPFKNHPPLHYNCGPSSQNICKSITNSFTRSVQKKEPHHPNKAQAIEDKIALDIKSHPVVDLLSNNVQRYKVAKCLLTGDCLVTRQQNAY